MKKGFSLVEIIISVGLIAIVMLFLFQILTDLQYEESNTNYASNNQLNRANVIQKVEEDFNTRFVKRIKLQNNGDGTSTVLFTFQENASSTLTVTPTTISYKNGSLPEGKNTFTYKINDNNFQYSNDIKITSDLVVGEANYVNLFCEEEDGNCGTSQFHYVKIRIPVINIKEEENNIQDDIELFYVGPFVENANKYKKFTLEITNNNSFITVNRTETKREEEVDLGELQNGANVYEQDKLMISVSPATGYENPKIFLNGEELAGGEYRVKDNEPGGIVSLSSTASLKEFGISLSGNNELPIIITRTSSNKTDASIGTINSTDKIYYGDKLKINFDSYDTAKYQNPILKINNRDYTAGQEIVVDSAVVINREATIREYNQTIKTRFEKADGTWEAYKTAATIKKKYGETVSYSVTQTNTYAAASITPYTVTGSKTVNLDIPRRTSTNIIQVRYQNGDGTYGNYSNVVNASYRVGQTVSWSRAQDDTYNEGEKSFKATASNQTKQISITRRKYELKNAPGTGIKSITPTSGNLYRVGQEVTIKAALNDGYNFDKWTTTGGSLADASKATTIITMPAKATTVTATGKLKTYTVTFDARGGIGGPTTQTKTYGKTLTLSSSKPTRAGFKFLSWNTKTNSSGTTYNPGGKYEDNKSVTLYAIWEATDKTAPVITCKVPQTIRTGKINYNSSNFTITDTGGSLLKSIQYYDRKTSKWVDWTNNTKFDTQESFIKMKAVDNANNRTIEYCYTGVDNTPPLTPILDIEKTEQENNINSITCARNIDDFGTDNECTVHIKSNKKFRFWFSTYDDYNGYWYCIEQEVDYSCAGLKEVQEDIYKQDGTLVRSLTRPSGSIFPDYTLLQNHYRILTSRDYVGNVSNKLKINVVYD